MNYFGWEELDLLKKRKANKEVVSFDDVSLNSLKRRGNLIAFLCIGFSLLSCSYVFYELFKLERLKTKLFPEIKLYEQVEKKYRNSLDEFKKVYDRNIALAGSIIKIPYNSAILTELQNITPQNIQLTSIDLNQGLLSIYGESTSPDSLDSINSFKINLENLIYTEDEAVVENVSSRSVNKPSDLELLDFIIKINISWPSVNELISELENSSSLGYSQKLNLLKSEGLIK